MDSWLESKEEPDSLEFCLTEWERGGMQGGGLERLTERAAARVGARGSERAAGSPVWSMAVPPSVAYGCAPSAVILVPSVVYGCAPQCGLRLCPPVP